MFSFQRTRLLLCVVSALILAPALECADIRSRILQATRDFKDVTLTCKVLYANIAELKKISSDFPKSYELKTTTVKYKSPDKMKMEGKLGMLKVSIMINGAQKCIRIPGLRYSRKEDISSEPHKRQSDLDIGIITGSLWRDYTVLDTANDKASETPVYRVTFVRNNSRDKKLVCWVDSKSLKLLKVEKHESDGTLRARYVYSDHTLVGDTIWVPGRVDVYNVEGKLAGTTAYTNIRLNTDLPDSEFKI